MQKVQKQSPVGPSKVDRRSNEVPLERFPAFYVDRDISPKHSFCELSSFAKSQVKVTWQWHNKQTSPSFPDHVANLDWRCRRTCGRRLHWYKDASVNLQSQCRPHPPSQTTHTHTPTTDSDTVMTQEIVPRPTCASLPWATAASENFNQTPNKATKDYMWIHTFCNTSVSCLHEQKIVFSVFFFFWGWGGGKVSAHFIIVLFEQFWKPDCFVA